MIDVAQVSVCVAVADGFTGHAIVKELLTGSFKHCYSKVCAAFISMYKANDDSDENEPEFDTILEENVTEFNCKNNPIIEEQEKPYRKSASSLLKLGGTVFEIGLPSTLVPERPDECAIKEVSFNHDGLHPPAPQQQQFEMHSRSSSVTISDGQGESNEPSPERKPSVFELVIKADDLFRAKLIELFSNFDSVCIVPPAIPNKLAYTKALIDACRDAGVKNVILITCLHSGQASTTYAPHLFEFHEMEDHLKRSCISHHCILRPSIYMEALLLWLPETLRKKKLCLPIGGTSFAPVSLTDVAKVVAKILTAPPPHTPYIEPQHCSAVYALTGPSIYSGSDIAALIEECLSCQVEFSSNSRNETRRFLEKKAQKSSGIDSDDAILKGKSISPSEVSVLLELLEEVAHKQLQEPNLSILNLLVGTTPTNLAKFLITHKERILY